MMTSPIPCEFFGGIRLNYFGYFRTRRITGVARKGRRGLQKFQRSFRHQGSSHNGNDSIPFILVKRSWSLDLGANIFHGDFAQ